mmetsp:Transcript_4032/g.6045  ORF Transcript_4032/g.6045 Transcript_4032/m.6045 type:complete len:86 (+) Transcript_4032:993-1250(+)
MFNQKQLKESALTKASRGGHTTSSDLRNEGRRNLFSKTSEDNRGSDSVLPLAGRTMGDDLNYDLENTFAVKTVSQPEKKLADFKS